MYYPVQEIVTKMRSTIRGDSSIDIFKHLEASVNASEQDKHLVLRAVGSWIKKIFSE